MQCWNTAVADGIGAINYKKDNSREMTAGRQDTEIQVKWSKFAVVEAKQSKTFNPKVATSFNLISILSFTWTKTATFTVFRLFMQKQNHTPQKRSATFCKHKPAAAAHYSPF